MQINDNQLESTIINEMQLNAKDTASFHNKSFGSGLMVAKSAKSPIATWVALL